MAEPLLETVDRLLERARPGGTPHRRLLKYREQLERNVVLGPSILKYIRDLVKSLDDTIECRYLSSRGRCRKTGRACAHVENNQECRLYQANRPQLRGNPLGRLA